MLSDYSLEDKVVLVTGGSKGIGRQIVRTLAGAGADVVVVSRNLNQAREAATEAARMGRKTLALSYDVSVYENNLRLVEESVSKMGRLDVLVNNAGMTFARPALEVTEAEWDKVFNLNIKGLFFTSQAAARVMKGQGGGKIINVASLAGLRGTKNMAPYAASKAAVVSLTKSLAREWGRYKIFVNAVAPGYIRTDMNMDALQNERLISNLISATPLGRLGEVEDIAGAVLLLAGKASDFMTGQTIVMDGGRGLGST